MTRRWWGGSSVSVGLHLALLGVLIYLAAHPPQVTATAAGPSARTRFVFAVKPGAAGAGGGSPAAGAPRTLRTRRSAPVTAVAPPAITNVEPLPAAVVPVIAAHNIDVVPGAPMPLDGSTIGIGSGPGAGGGRGPGLGPGEGRGAGDVYEGGVGGVTQPTLIREVKPNYTADAMRGKIQGLVRMDVEVRADGTVNPNGIRITRSLDPGLDREAVIAVRQWVFRPSLLLGRAVASRVIVELAFTLR